jgi:hypothetical protein
MQSSNDTVISRAGQTITDAAGNIWSIVNGQVAVNGQIDGTTANVIQMAYENGTVWQKNADNLWWGKTAPTDAWSPTYGTAIDPIPGQQASANDAIIVEQPSGTIVDPLHNTWSIANEQVLINGVADPTTARVVQLVYSGGAVWQQNADGLWWAKTSPTAAWEPTYGTSQAPVPDPSAAVNHVALVTTDPPIMDASGNAWSIQDGQVTLNGVPDPTTRNVIELAYAGGKVWQENQDHLWWSKTTPSDPWGPEYGTPQSPVAGVTRTWQNQDGHFSTGANWSPSGVPQAGDTAVIQNGSVTVDPGDGTGVNFLLENASASFTQGDYDIGQLRGNGTVVIGYPPHAATLFATGVLLVGNQLGVSEFGASGGRGSFVITGDSTLTKGASLKVNEVGTASLPLGTIENDGTMSLLLGSAVTVGQINGTGTVSVTEGSTLNVQLGAAASETVKVQGYGHLDIGLGALPGANPDLHFLAPIALDNTGTITLERTQATTETFRHIAPNLADLQLFNGSTLVADLKIAGEKHVYATYDPGTGAGGRIIITAQDSGHALPIVPASS